MGVKPDLRPEEQRFLKVDRRPAAEDRREVRIPPPPGRSADCVPHNTGPDLKKRPGPPSAGLQYVASCGEMTVYNAAVDVIEKVIELDPVAARIRIAEAEPHRRNAVGILIVTGGKSPAPDQCKIGRLSSGRKRQSNGQQQGKYMLQWHKSQST